MKHWRFFPILVKEEVLKNMGPLERFSFSKCSKNCWNLLSRIPNHLEYFRILYDDRRSVLLTSSKSTIRTLEVKIESDLEKERVDQFLLNRHTLKVKKLILEISPEYSEMYKKLIDFCDPSFIECMHMEQLDSLEAYKEIRETPQYKNSQEVILTWDFLMKLFYSPAWLGPEELRRLPYCV
ncbi:hypothetical protein CAEBREN_05032 [Caenorhabditis brenneri]|uniref:F-box domain-containing protein n=1 Tax=Caenorhabditis brenneri TaxID=135651 RepID=G0MN55_CAEBE|nr:hypothetical protein CAEBREN_05032 [Caenorhabditis brenneri]